MNFAFGNGQQGMAPTHPAPGGTTVDCPACINQQSACSIQQLPVSIAQELKQLPLLMGCCCHVVRQVFMLRYPYQEDLRDWDHTTAAANSAYVMPNDLFYRLHPFHLIMDTQCHLIQAGPAMARVCPNMRVGEPIVKYFKVCLLILFGPVNMSSYH